MRSKPNVTVINIPETEFEMLLRRTADYLRKERKSPLLTKLRPMSKKRSSAA